MDIEPVLEAARRAKENGSTRFCMGAAWRDLAGRKSGFQKILTMVREVRGMGMEVCTTLGMLSPDQARQLKEAYVCYSQNPPAMSDFLAYYQRSHGVQSQLGYITRVLPVCEFCSADIEVKNLTNDEFRSSRLVRTMID